MRITLSFREKNNYKIYNKDNRYSKLWNIIHLFWLIGIVLLVVYLLKFGNLHFDLSDNHKHWVDTFTILSGIMAFIATGLLIVNLRAGQKAVKKSNTLSVCIDVFKELRSTEFLDAEATIGKYLSDKKKELTPKQKEDLQKAITSYLHIMNNISALVIHDIIDDEPIISYKGVDILYYYNMLEDYITDKRTNFYKKAKNDTIISDNETKQILIESSPMCYAHFELFIKQIKAKSPYLIKEFKKRLAE